MVQSGSKPGGLRRAGTLSLHPAKGAALGSCQELCSCTSRRVFDPFETHLAIFVLGSFGGRRAWGWGGVARARSAEGLPRGHGSRRASRAGEGCGLAFAGARPLHPTEGQRPHSAPAPRSCLRAHAIPPDLPPWGRWPNEVRSDEACPGHMPFRKGAIVLPSVLRGSPQPINHPPQKSIDNPPTYAIIEHENRIHRWGCGTGNRRR